MALNRRPIALTVGFGLLALVLSGCGFRPLYAKTGSTAGVSAAMSQIDVIETKTRVAFKVRSRLVELLQPSNGPGKAYDLRMTINERQEGLAIEQDTSVTRYNFELTGLFVLTDKASGEVLTRGSSRAVAAYNVVDSQFATEIARRDVRDRAAQALGEDIHKQLAIYFDRNPVAPKP
jgi:LPS-assembly lipoprotein